MIEFCLKMVSLSGMMVTVVFFSALTDGAAFLSTDACPEGVSPGETWVPDVIPGTETAAVCMKCSCLKPGPNMPDGGFSCYSCGVMMPVLPSPACYVTKAAPDQPYPECCQIAVRCPGDDGYNPTMAIPNGDIVG